MAAVERLDARAMASAVEIVVVGSPGGAARRTLEHLRSLEDRWTRFSPHSDISRLNAAHGAPVEVDGSTLVLVTALIEGWHLTGGRFDPSTLPALVAAGYGTSIEDPRRTTTSASDALPGADLDLVEVDLDASTVRLPRRATLDPGGLGKGLAADLAVDRLLAEGAAGALVSIGGDLTVGGQPPQGDAWAITVEDPHLAGRSLRELHVDHGGVATSSTLTRRIGPGGSTHHTIDAATGRPVATDVAAVTVVAATGWQAEALATGALVGGAAGCREYLTGHGADGLVVTLDGRVLATPDLTVRPDAEVRT